MEGKNTAQFKNEVKELVGDEYTVISQYVNRVEKITLRHNVCGTEYKVAPTNFLRGERCPYCSFHRRRTSPESFQKWFDSEVGDEYTLLTPYVKSAIKVTVKHNVCGNTYEVTPNNFKRGKRCPYCHNRSLVKTQEQFKKELFEKWGSNITLVDSYKGVNEVSTFHCERHNCNFSMYPTSILKTSEHGCPICKHEFSPTPFQFTEPEQKIFEELTRMGINFVYQKMFTDCKSNVSNTTLSFDFFIPNKNLVIEYDGRQHRQPVDVFGGKSGYDRTHRNDIVKNNYAHKNKISISRIPSTYQDYIGVVDNLISSNEYVVGKDFII